MENSKVLFIGVAAFALGYYASKTSIFQEIMGTKKQETSVTVVSDSTNVDDQVAALQEYFSGNESYLSQFNDELDSMPDSDIGAIYDYYLNGSDAISDANIVATYGLPIF